MPGGHLASFIVLCPFLVFFSQIYKTGHMTPSCKGPFLQLEYIRHLSQRFTKCCSRRKMSIFSGQMVRNKSDQYIIIILVALMLLLFLNHMVHLVAIRFKNKTPRLLYNIIIIIPSFSGITNQKAL